MRMKKIVNLLVCTCMVSSILLIPAQAAQTNQKQEESSTSIELSDLDTVEYVDEENVYKYGIADNYLQWGDFKNVLDNSNDGTMTLYEPSIGSNVTIVVQPIYRTYKNTGLKAAAEIITAYLVSKLPGKITKNPLLNWCVEKMTDFSSAIKTTYVGSWVWESDGDEYVTLVHYKDSTYKDPIKVEIINITDL